MHCVLAKFMSHPLRYPLKILSVEIHVTVILLAKEAVSLLAVHAP